jgi:hypothetical protein
MVPAYERRFGIVRWPAGRAEDSTPRPNIDVVFTSAPAALAALKKADALVSHLNARITLIVPQIVPYPLPLTSPPVLLEFAERQLRRIVQGSPVEMIVRLYLCRDPWIALKEVLSPRSLVIVGGRRRWWFTREERLARRLRRAGYRVVYTEIGVDGDA